MIDHDKALSGNKQNPEQPRRPSTYNESVDEPGELLREEPVEIEAERPQTPNPNIDRGEKDKPTPPAFEE